ncbi:serine dehydratase-like [Sceloporus undulatus]|uniref:serine dehydratase-like n=1 Tax=Sceloporus undulatus TaxID=8520 RepID=UPI001C4CE9EC|nr:serine dehydratase-like [Sceloporus undulatus]
MRSFWHAQSGKLKNESPMLGWKKSKTAKNRVYLKQSLLLPMTFASSCSKEHCETPAEEENIFRMPKRHCWLAHFQPPPPLLNFAHSAESANVSPSKKATNFFGSQRQTGTCFLVGLEKKVVSVTPMEEALGGTNGRPFHVVTPVLESVALSQAAGTKVYMKMENVQPTGSFKIRGIGYFCQQVAKKGCQRFACSSGGNAGLAAAFAARKLGIPITVIVPKTTGEVIVKRLEEQGAEVEVFGQVWDEANLRAVELSKQAGCIFVHPFDHPLIWKGHNSIVKELRDSLDAKPGAIVLSVGGGGLLAGVVSGLQEVGWPDVPIIAVETRGADSFHAAITAGRLVTLPAITSVAKCLGAKTVAQRALDCARECQIVSHVLEDVEAVKAIEQFLDDERMFVEAACGASVAFLYSGYLQKLQKEGRLSRQLDSVVLIVCGGNAIQMEELQAMKNQLGMK